VSVKNLRPVGGWAGVSGGRVSRHTRGAVGIDLARAGQAVDTVIDHLLRVGIDGGGTLVSAQRAAERALRAAPDPEAAIDRLITTHSRLAAAGGFATGLGGFAALPVALPVNVLGFYAIATRMVAAIAAVRGYDLADPSVRTTVLLALTGKDASQVIKHVGLGVDGVLAHALRAVSPTMLMVVNKAVAFRILIQIGRQGIARFGRAIPVVGGLVGAAFDVLLLGRLAHEARQHFPNIPR